MKRMIFAISILMLMVCGCQPQTTTPDEPVRDEPIANLKAIILGTPPAEGMDELYRQLDELTIPELNCTLRFEYIPWGDERAQLNTAIASGEYDLIPGGVFSDYRTLAGKNAFLNLNDYLELVPELKAHFASQSEHMLEDCEINGGLYGIPQYSTGIENTDEGFFYREDLRKAWGLEPVADLETMESYLYRAKEEPDYRDQPLITDNRIWTSLWLMLSEGRYLEVGSMLETPFLVARADDPGVLVSRMETPEFQEVLRYIRKWQEDGILESDMLALSDNEGARGKQMILANLKPCETNIPFWALSSFSRESETEHPDWEYSYFPYVTNQDKWYWKSVSDVSVISVSSRTLYPEIAVRLLEKAHTDQRYYDLLRHGVEGIHYKLVDGMLDFTDIPTENGFGWTPVGDMLMEYESRYASEKWYEETAKPYDDWGESIQARTEDNPLSGFRLELKGLEQVLEEIEQIRLQYFQPILCGYQDDPEEALEEAVEMLRRAGFETYFDQIQKQLTEYWAAR